MRSYLAAAGFGGIGNWRMVPGVVGGIFLLLLLVIGSPTPAWAETGQPVAVGARPELLPAPVEKVAAREKCPVCGMFVARYPEWISQLHLDGGEVHFFDGMKDLLAYYFHPANFGGRAEAQVKAIWTKDYYTLQWLEARQAYFVVGSSVHGPMGHEFLPLASREAADTFMRDHQGREILTFDQITAERVQAMRSGHRMGPGH
jgi:copper chaperone NosL